MSIDSRLLDILCCPYSRQSLSYASRSQLERINRAIDAGELRDGAGATLSEHIDDALLTRDQRRLYRIDDGIPVLLVEEGIELGALLDPAG